MSEKKKGNAEPVQAIEPKSLENFMNTYMNAYREYITGKDMDEIHTPQFFKGFPFSADIYAMPNGSVCTLFKKSNRSRFTSLEGDFETVLARLKNQDLDFMTVLPPFTSFTEEEAKRLARMDADKDLKSSRRLEMLTAAESHISSIHNDVQSVADLNPWLDQQAAEQREKLDKARALILELYNEVDISREERFSDYMRDLSEVMAFERGDMEEVASQIELEVETAIEEMETRLSGLEDAINGLGKKFGASEKSLLLVSGLGQRLDKLENVGSNSDLKQSIDGLQDSLKELNSDFREMEKGFKSITSDFSEIKETVLRDSKRTFNLNERITDLERLTANMKSDTGKENVAAVKALEGRFNVMDKNLKDLARMVVQPVSPVVVESPVVETVERTPSGATVKKTVKKTTTKKTTRSK